jgi:adenine-specific DNA-methyltransferase
MTIWSHTDVGHNHGAVDELRKIMGSPIFDNPKPSSLLRRILEITTGDNEEEDSDEKDIDNIQDNEIVLDFFAGSGTTAHSVLDLNNKDGGNRKFILVQLPEPIKHDDYCTIADITKERVRCVIKNLDADDKGRLLLDGKQDRGFRVFKLTESNFKSWDAQAPQEAKGLETQLELHIEHLREGRTSDDILYELLLKSGFPLTTPIERLKLAGKQVFSVAGGALLICLEKELTLEALREMAGKKPERVVCLDAGFAGNDQLKTNAVQIFKSAGVTSFRTV